LVNDGRAENNRQRLERAPHLVYLVARFSHFIVENKNSFP
jgi:hypothetical protein